jgi:F-type H+-transporting ATPase subunit delta
MASGRVARRYVVALMDVALEAKAVDSVARDLELVQKTLAASRDLRRMMASPVVSRAKKWAVFRELFASHVGKETMSFFELLLEKDREAELPEIAEQFLALRDEKLGLVTVEVTTAVAFPPDREDPLKGLLERHTGKSVKLRIAVDASIKAGMVLKIGDTVLDGSVTRQLARLRERLIEGSALSN